MVVDSSSIEQYSYCHVHYVYSRLLDGIINANNSLINKGLTKTAYKFSISLVAFTWKS